VSGPRVGVGDPAPDFVLAGTLGAPQTHRDFSLAEFRGRAVVLAFYPADNSPVCTAQLGEYSSRLDDLDIGGVTVLAISPQSIESHDAFARKQGGLAFALLADRDKSVGERYGILGPLGFYRRSIFVVDAEGVIRYAHRSVTSLGYQSTAAIAAELRKLL
jgi:thioredoxin-dependent peroxiredoxin